MALLERVTTLIRANLNDLIDRAEDPQKMLKQVLLDMQNQLMQVKTQVAIAMADQHLLAKKLKENEEAQREWIRKAELAVDKKQEELARAAIERALTHQQLTVSYGQQLADQDVQVETLKSALLKLEQKMIEVKGKVELLVSQQRRARALSKATDARASTNNGAHSGTLDRMKDKIRQEEAVSLAKAQLENDNFENRLLAIGKEEQIEQILTEIKERRIK